MALFLLGVAALCAAVVLWRRPTLRSELITQPTPTQAAPGYDRTAATREVLLPAQTWYTIQTGVFSTQEAAQEKASAYTDRGAPGTVVADGGKWRVFIASYGREEDAAAVRQRLGEIQRVETYLYAWTCPEIRLRLSGMAGQLDVAEAGLTLMSGAGEILRDTAMLLDASQLTAEEAMTAALELDGQIRLWAETARERFGRQPPDMVQELLSLADDWENRFKELQQAAASATTLSAGLKLHGMGMFDDMISLRRALSEK